MLAFTAQGRIEVYLNGVLISRHVQEREAIESISRHGGVGTYEVVYPKVLVRKVERVSRETFIETGYGYGSGMAVEVVRRIVDTTAPSVGSLTAYGMTASQVSLTWSDTGASYYELYKSLDGTNWGFLTTTADVVYNDTGLSVGTFYHYRYRAVDQTGNKSAFSATVAPIFPAVPTSLTVTGVTGTTITLDWADNSHPVSNYKVYRSTNGTTYSLIASPTSSTYPDSGLSSGQIYYYKVSAVTAYGESAQSSAVSQTTTAAGPDWIQNLPAINFVRGTQGQTFNFYPTYLNTNNNVNVAVENGTLPPEIRIESSPTPRLAYDGTGTGSISSQVSFRVSTSAEADWQSRINAAGVVWYHDFRSDAEVNRFRWQGGIGNDLNGTGDGNCRRITTDYITGSGCLEINIPAGGTVNSGWMRPYSPLTGATNGKGVDDPGANPQAWNVSHGTDYLGQWKKGWYSHSDYQGGTFPTYSFDGTEFYIQFRVKISANRFLSGQPPGKLIYLGVTGNGTSHSTPWQEIVLQSLQSRIVRAYTNFGSSFNSALNEPQQAADASGSIKQPGGDYASTCINNLSCAICWCWPSDTWVTVLMHMRPGHHGTSLSQTSAQDTLMEIKVALPGDTTYTTIYSKSNYVIEYTPGGMPYGYSEFEASGYMNGVPALAGNGWTHRYTQIIFSKQPIAVPAV